MSNKEDLIVLLTGATGFLGSHLLQGLLNNDYRVIVLKRSFSDTSQIEKLIPKVRIFDLDKVPLRRVFEEQHINIVIHSATNYGRSSERVSQIIESNLMFPIELLELACEFNIDTFFNTDTALPGCLNFYVLSKRHFLEYAQRLADKCEMQFVNVRLEHMYGPNDGSSKFISFLIRTFLTQKSSVDLTSGEQLRDFVFIDDVVDAFLILLKNRDKLDTSFETFDLGSGETISIQELAVLTHKICDGNTEMRFGALAYRDGEIMQSQADISKLLHLGWSQKVMIHEGLSRTVQAERDVIYK